MELKDLTNIAYGDERLFVSKTEIVWTSADSITFKYMYQLDGNGSNGTVTSLIIGEAKNSSGAVCSEGSYTIKSDAVDTEGYSTITIKHTGLPEIGYKEQEVTIKAGTLMRTINLILINPYASQVGCSATSGLTVVPTTAPEIPLTVGSPVYVYFSMPAGLPESIFPLTFILSPEAHSITPPGGDMPVTSLLTHANSTMQGLKYGFEKVVTWDKYKNNVSTGMIVECPFKTSLAESATNIYVYNEYFNFPLSTSFTNPDLSLYNKVSIPGGNITAQGQYIEDTYNQTWNIYTDSNFTNSIGTCSFTRTETSNGFWGGTNITYSLNALTLYIPKDVTTLYFVYRSNSYTYYGSMSVSNIKDAENAQKTLNNITRVSN